MKTLQTAAGSGHPWSPRRVQSHSPAPSPSTLPLPQKERKKKPNSHQVYCTSGFLCRGESDMKSIPRGVLPPPALAPNPPPKKGLKTFAQAARCPPRPERQPGLERQVRHVPRPRDVTHLAVQGDTPLPHLVRDHEVLLRRGPHERALRRHHVSRLRVHLPRHRHAPLLGLHQHEVLLGHQALLWRHHALVHAVAHHALLGRYACPAQHGHLSRMAHGHAESPLHALLPGEAGGIHTWPRRGLLSHHVLQVHEVEVGRLRFGGLAVALGEILQGAAWLLRRDDPGQVKLGDARGRGADDLTELGVVQH